MRAYIGLPGSQYFRTTPALSKADAEAWVAKHFAAHREAYRQPIEHGVITEREAKRWRYRDGTRCFRDDGDDRGWDLTDDELFDASIRGDLDV